MHTVSTQRSTYDYICITFRDAKEVDRNEAFYLQNSKLLKVELSHGNVKAQFGSMIAYQGDASFKKKRL